MFKRCVEKVNKNRAFYKGDFLFLSTNVNLNKVTKLHHTCEY